MICRPYGMVRLNIKATWIQNASPQQDALTDLSFMSSLGQQSMNSSGIGTDTVEQVNSPHAVYLRMWCFGWRNRFAVLLFDLLHHSHFGDFEAPVTLENLSSCVKRPCMLSTQGVSQYMLCSAFNSADSSQAESHIRARATSTTLPCSFCTHHTS